MHHKKHEVIILAAITAFISIAAFVLFTQSVYTTVNTDYTEKNYLLTQSNDLNDPHIWMWYPAVSQYYYTLTFLPQINQAMGLTPDEFTVDQIRLMTPDDPDYNICNAYTDYTNDLVYLNMQNIGFGMRGAEDAVRVLAHEVRHLYQDKYDTIPYRIQDPNDRISYMADPREIDANQFANAFIANIYYAGE